MTTREAKAVGIGLVTGLLSGLLGVGGGFVMVPGMVYLLRVEQHKAHGTTLLTIIPIALVGSLVLGARHQVDLQVALPLAISAIGGAVLGARLAGRLSSTALRRIFGITAIAVGLLMIGDVLGHAFHWSPVLLVMPKAAGWVPWIALGVGLISGIGSGLLGIGGGIVIVPALVLLLGVSQHAAQGTSLAVIVPTALAGSITHFRLGNLRLATAGWMALGGAAGAAAGAVAALATPDQTLRVLFATYLVLTGLRMTLSPNPPI